ncbi:FAD-binding domain-containing protein [Roridomyces roridus]|uniref:FAD-binding domain-containing protein n=1 Tax=Roridomyces roridus TaxID=1738132 RepID=A0AAD7BZX5_9AGAR|nr:FAD-binding domain-containing protein [Roridomyces roridus]
MKSLSQLTSLCILLSSAICVSSLATHCRNVPGSNGYPSVAAWSAFNASISGRLVDVVPSAEFCARLPGGACTDAQWGSALFRNGIPGSMEQVNWEQGYDQSPPSLCFQNQTTLCGQGNVPVYSVEAESVADVQAAIKFATTNNLRLVIKSSGHDQLGRSTAPGALLLRTTALRNISFTDNFYVGDNNMGPAVTFGSGMPGHTVYKEGATKGRIVTAGAAATVCPGGGYLQGTGHSPLSPLLGLAADNALEFQIVVASGELLTVNEDSHPDLFFALRGGGAGSWGVLISATVKTFPTFNLTQSIITLGIANDTAASALATVHARHIHMLDSVRGGQYYYLEKAAGSTVFWIDTYLPHTTPDEAETILKPFLDEALNVEGVEMISSESTYADVNDILYDDDDSVGFYLYMGSRLIPESAYDTPETVGEVYEGLLDAGSQIILGHIIAGGQVAENANISSAVHPAWRTAKTHLILVNEFTDAPSPADVFTIHRQFQDIQLPIVEKISGPNAGSYSNEADLLEPNFQTTFFGPNYAKLSAIKSMYDPEDLFIVGAGVGSERWDQWGICRV